MTENTNKISIGNCGEYFVAGELERRGYTVALPLSNVKDFDLLAICKETNRQIAVQIKTTENNKKRWVLSKKCETLIDKNIYYILVRLDGTNIPSYHIVPSEVLANEIRTGHKRWLAELGKNGKIHRDNNMRVFMDENERFLNRWDLLKSKE